MTMPPSYAMTNTSIRANDSLKKRLGTKSHRTASSSGSDNTTPGEQSSHRRSTVDTALGRYVDDMECDDVAKRPSLTRRDRNDSWGASEHSASNTRRSRTNSGSKRSDRRTSIRDPLSPSDHSSSRRQRAHSSKRVSRPGDNFGALEGLLKQVSPGRSKRKGARTVAVTQNDTEFGEEALKGDERSIASVPATAANKNRDVRTGRKKTDRERAASPGPMKRRSESLGPIKKRSSSIGPLKKRSASPGPMKKASTSPGPIKKRSTSLDPMKQKERSQSLGPMKKRSESPGPMKKRSESPGTMKKRTHSPGALSTRKRSGDSTHRSTRSERVSRPGDDNGELGDLLNEMSAGKPKRKGSRSVASAPVQDLTRPERRLSPGKYSKQLSMRRPESGISRRGPPSKAKSADALEIMNAANQMSEYDWDGTRPSEEKETSETTHSTHPGESSSTTTDYESPRNHPSAVRRSKISQAKLKRSVSAVPGSNTRAPRSSTRRGNSNDDDLRDELAKQKVKRNLSLAPQGSRSYEAQDGPENGGGLQRAQSMLLHREMTRRGKSNSLMDLIQYKEEEIHSTSYFASNHVLVNRERMKRGLRPLSRNIAMDELARQSAQAMAESNGLNPLRTTYVGNVLRGESIRSIHRSTMQQKQGRERANLLNPYFQDFGVGTAKGADGMLYMCQLFSERIELALTDTTKT